jgi:hypothetical protein
MQKVLVSTAGPDLGSALNDLRPRLDALQSRLARDPIVTTLPPPGRRPGKLAIKTYGRRVTS